MEVVGEKGGLGYGKQEGRRVLVLIDTIIVHANTLQKVMIL
jgi:hypothetical protein